MSVQLLHPTPRMGPIVHQLSHDLESLCMILIHIMCFTFGPVGTPTSKGQHVENHRVAQWHHEHSLAVLQDLKSVDLHFLYKHPEDYVSEYWAPIAPFLSKLLLVVYPGIQTFDLDSRKLVFEDFRSTLVDALKYTNTIREEPRKYAALSQRRPTAAQKRTRVENLVSYPNTRARTSISQIQPFRPAATD